MATGSGADEPQFLEYVRALRRRKWWVVGAALVGIGGAAGYAYTSTKVYTASATVLVTGTPNLNGNTPSGTVNQQQLQIDAELLKTAPVRAAVHKVIPGRPAKVVGLATPANDTITITATGASARLVALTANTYAHVFIANRQAAAISDGNSAAALIGKQLTEIGVSISNTEADIAKAPPKSTEAATLQAQLSSFEAQQASLTSERAQVLLESELASGGVTLESKAVRPALPTSPRPHRDMLFGGLAGLILGLGVALGVDSIDDRIRSREDVERGFPRLPILGFIPYIEAWRVSKNPYLVSVAAPLSTAAEAFRSVRTAIQFVRIDRPLKTILITSASAGDGKTATVANLGVGMAKAGRSVCIVSADLRRPRLGEFFAEADSVGLTSVAIGEATLDESLQQVPDVPGLWYLGTGPTPIEAGEFLGSRRTAAVFSELAERFDVVLIDTPPLLAVADALVMTAYADGVVVVIRQGVSRRRSLARVRELLLQGDAEVLGAVFSQASPETFGRYYGGYGRYGYYRYGYGYGQTYGSYGDDGSRARRHAARGGRSKDTAGRAKEVRAKGRKRGTPTSDSRDGGAVAQS